MLRRQRHTPHGAAISAALLTSSSALYHAVRYQTVVGNAPFNAEANRHAKIKSGIAEGTGIYHEDFGGLGSSSWALPTTKGHAIDGKGVPIKDEEMTTSVPPGYKLPLQGLHGAGKSNVPKLLHFDKERVPDREKGLSIKRSKTRELFNQGMDTHKNLAAAQDPPPALGEGDRRLTEGSQDGADLYMFDAVTAADTSASGVPAIVESDGEKKPFQLHHIDQETKLRQDRWALAKGLAYPSSTVHEVQSPFQRRHSSLEGDLPGENWAATPEERQHQMTAGLGGGGGALDVPADSQVPVGEQGFVLNPYHSKHAPGNLQPYIGDNSSRHYKPEAGDPDSTIRVAPKHRKQVLNTNELIDMVDPQQLSEEGQQVKINRANANRARAEELDAALGLSHDPQRRGRPPSRDEKRLEKSASLLERAEERLDESAAMSNSMAGRDIITEFLVPGVGPNAKRPPWFMEAAKAAGPKYLTRMGLPGGVADESTAPGYKLNVPSRGIFGSVKRILKDVPWTEPHAVYHTVGLYNCGHWIMSFIMFGGFLVFHKWQCRNDMAKFYDEYLGLDLTRCRMEAGNQEEFYLGLVTLGVWLWLMGTPTNLLSLIGIRTWRTLRGRPLGPP